MSQLFAFLNNPFSQSSQNLSPSSLNLTAATSQILKTSSPSYDGTSDGSLSTSSHQNCCENVENQLTDVDMSLTNLPTSTSINSHGLSDDSSSKSFASCLSSLSKKDGKFSVYESTHSPTPSSTHASHNLHTFPVPAEQPTQKSIENAIKAMLHLKTSPPMSPNSQKSEYDAVTAPSLIKNPPSSSSEKPTETVPHAVTARYSQNATNNTDEAAEAIFSLKTSPPLSPNSKESEYDAVTANLLVKKAPSPFSEKPTESFRHAVTARSSSNTPEITEQAVESMSSLKNLSSYAMNSNVAQNNAVTAKLSLKSLSSSALNSAVTANINPCDSPTLSQSNSVSTPIPSFSQIVDVDNNDLCPSSYDTKTQKADSDVPFTILTQLPDSSSPAPDDDLPCKQLTVLDGSDSALGSNSSNKNVLSKYVDLHETNVSTQLTAMSNDPPPTQNDKFQSKDTQLTVTKHVAFALPKLPETVDILHSQNSSNVSLSQSSISSSDSSSLVCTTKAQKDSTKGDSSSDDAETLDEEAKQIKATIVTRLSENETLAEATLRVFKVNQCYKSHEHFKKHVRNFVTAWGFMVARKAQGYFCTKGGKTQVRKEKLF